MQICFLIPLYNHGKTLPSVVASLRTYQLPILIIDDGSHEETRAVALQLEKQYEQVEVLVRPVNGGKGAAVMDGLRLAAQRGYSHAIQIDADGQHHTPDIQKFIAAAQAEPTVMWSGKPIYDDTVPQHRFYCRYLTHVLVWLETCSLEIEDSMCGFRVYPVAGILPVIERYTIPGRMAFDTEILVRFFWLGGRIKQIATPVIYPEHGISHFRMLHDNLILVWMHCRLLSGMLWRFPYLILRNIFR